MEPNSTSCESFGRSPWSAGNGMLFWALLAVFWYGFLMNAWVVDDAYITFRTIDNAVSGYGLTWNPGERLQTYTHPLWMLLMLVLYWFTSDVFYTVIAISLVLSTLTIVVPYFSFRAQGNGWKGPVLLVVLFASKAFMDYSSSGLETPLSYFIAALFCTRFLLNDKHLAEFDAVDFSQFVLLASLAFVNRQDTILYYLPALCVLGVLQFRAQPGTTLLRLATASLPATGWLVFSMVYYGFPFPNTAYAKMMCTGVPLADRVSRGVMYALNSISWDMLSWGVLVSAAVLSLMRREAKSQSMVCGAIFHVFYVIVSAAAATHMSGRFFAVSFLVGALVLVNLLRTTKPGMAVAAASVVFMAWSPVSSIKMGTTFYGVPEQSASFIDTKWFVHREGAALRNFRPGKTLPDHVWYHQGAKFRADPARVCVGGAFHGENLGYFGFAAGPDKYIIDPVGLGDPLLARLPATNAKGQHWKSGHFRREIPEGYLDSIVESKNLIQAPGLHEYYDRLLRITRGPIFDKQRFLDILVVNTSGCCNLSAASSRSNE